MNRDGSDVDDSVEAIRVLPEVVRHMTHYAVLGNTTKPKAMCNEHLDREREVANDAHTMQESQPSPACQLIL